MTSVTSWSPMTTASARFAPSLESAARNAGGSGFTAFATMGSSKRCASSRTPTCQLLDTRQNDTPASRACANHTHPHVARHLVRVAGEDGVVHVQKDAAKARLHQVAADVHLGQAREVSVRFKKRHGASRGFGQAGAYENVSMCSS